MVTLTRRDFELTVQRQIRQAVWTVGRRRAQGVVGSEVGLREKRATAARSRAPDTHADATWPGCSSTDGLHGEGDIAPAQRCERLEALRAFEARATASGL